MSTIKKIFFLASGFMMLYGKQQSHDAKSTTMKASLPPGWYPQNKEKLHNRLKQLDQEAHDIYGSYDYKPYVLIVPHAGYAYSGKVAASAFRLLDHHDYDRMIVLAPSHTVPFQGIAVPVESKALELATGKLLFDTKSIKKLSMHKPFIDAQSLKWNPFKNEHSFEIECPFLHHYLKEKTPIIPLMIGYLDDKDITTAANVLKKYITEKTLIVTSSDLTHYGEQFDFMPFGPLPGAMPSIHMLDGLVIETLFKKNTTDFLNLLKSTQATVCGKYPLALLLEIITKTDFNNYCPHLMAYATSHDQPDYDKNSSVSYGALIYTKEAKPTHYEQGIIIDYVKNLIMSFFDKQAHDITPLIDLPCLKQKCGTFVTLNTPSGQLRGCIGRIQADKTLGENLPIYTQEAAFHDTRFAPLTQEEAQSIIPSVTVLKPFKTIASYKDIVLGKHGILLTNGTHQAVFLPQVPVEQSWNLYTTLEQLSLKAGLTKNAWKDKNTTFQVCEGYEIKF